MDNIKEIKDAFQLFVDDEYTEAKEKLSTVISNKTSDYFKNKLELKGDYGFGNDGADEK